MVKLICQEFLSQNFFFSLFGCVFSCGLKLGMQNSYVIIADVGRGGKFLPLLAFFSKGKVLNEAVILVIADGEILFNGF